MTYFVLLLISVAFSRLASWKWFNFLFVLWFRLISLQNNDMVSWKLALRWRHRRRKKQVIGLMRSNDCCCCWCWRVGPSVVRVCLCVCVCRMSFQLENAFFNFLNVMWCMIRFTMHYVPTRQTGPTRDRYCSALRIFPLAKQLQFSNKTWQCLQLKNSAHTRTRILNVKTDADAVVVADFTRQILFCFVNFYGHYSIESKVDWLESETIPVTKGKSIKATKTKN